MRALHQELEQEKAGSSARVEGLRAALQAQEARSTALDQELRTRPTSKLVRISLGHRSSPGLHIMRTKVAMGSRGIVHEDSTACSLAPGTLWCLVKNTRSALSAGPALGSSALPVMSG